MRALGAKLTLVPSEGGRTTKKLILEMIEVARELVAAIQVARKLGPGGKVVTLMADSGLKYLSTDVYMTG